MKTLFIAACLLLSACYLPTGYVVHDEGYATQQPWLVDPIPQQGSNMSFMCRNAINRGDSGGAFIYC